MYRQKYALGRIKKNSKNKTFCTVLLNIVDNVPIFFFTEYNVYNSIWQKLTLIRLIFLTVSIKLET